MAAISKIMLDSLQLSESSLQQTVFIKKEKNIILKQVSLLSLEVLYVQVLNRFVVYFWFGIRPKWVRSKE